MSAGPRPDRAAVTAQLLAWVLELVPEARSAPLNATTDLRDFAGFDSLVLLQLLIRAEEEFDVPLVFQDPAIAEALSVAALSRHILDQMGG